MVDERFLDHRAGDLVADIDRDLVITDRERHVAAIDLGDQRTDRFVGRRAFKTLKPERIFFQSHEFFLIERNTCSALDR